MIGYEMSLKKKINNENKNVSLKRKKTNEKVEL